MVAPDAQDPQLILVVAEADLVSDFQQHFTARGMTIRYAEDPTAAREVVATQRARLVVIPVEGACLALLQAWEEGEAPADLVIGLVEHLSEASAAPKSVTRTARKGQPKEIVSLAELLLRSSPAIQKPPAAAAVDAGVAVDAGAAVDAGEAVDAGGAESIWNKPGGILKHLDAEKLVADEKPVADADADADEEADVDEGDFGPDPSRVSDIRSLGVAVRMAKAVRADEDAKAAPLPALSLKLSHDGEDGDDDEGEEDKPAGITDAMALLPQARAAESEDESIARLSAERAAQSVDERQAVRDPTAPALAPEPEVVFRKSRKGLILVIVAVLVLAGGGLAAYLLLRPKPKPESKPRGQGPAAAQASKTTKPPRFKRGVHEDHFAGTIAQLPAAVTALDVDVSDEFLNRSVPELNPYMELALRRLSRRKRRKTLMDQGTKLLGWERYPEARRFLKQAVELKDGPKARAALSRAYQGLGRNWAAIVHLHQAIKKDQKNDAYHMRLGLLYLKEDKKKKGCEALNHAARLNKSHGALVDKHCGKGNRRRRRRARRRR
jgi:hypothetical protein